MTPLPDSRHGPTADAVGLPPAALESPPASAVLPAPGLLEALEAWRARLAGAGVACRAVALHAAEPQHALDLPESLAELRARWHALRATALPGSAPVVVRPSAAPGADLLLVAPLQMPDGRPGAVGVVLAPPHNERVVQLVTLSLGWLQLSLAATWLARSQRAAQLLDLLGHVASQDRARAAAQEWINRSAAWARELAPAGAPGFNLMLFRVQGRQPRWWVTADTAWSEKGSPAIQQAAELAAQAVLDEQDVQMDGALALTALDEGRVAAVLVALPAVPGAGLPAPMVDALRTALGLAEPLLRHWQRGERPLWRHTLDSVAEGWRRLREPGALAWKTGLAAGALGAALLLLVPVPDRVTASTVIEGRVRQVVTAPFEGFIGQVLVRPGERVTRGQVLVRLDDRDLKLEQARFRSEREQAASRLRQAMSEREAAAMALALAEVQQAEAQLSLVEAKLARAALVAPLDGLVTSGDWVQQIGGPVETGKEMFEIAAGEGWRVALHVPDRDIGRVRVGQDGVLRLAGQPQDAHAFRISNLTATASVQDGVNGFRVEAEWVGAVPPLSPGMQGVGKIDTGRANLLTVWTRSSVDWLRLKLWSWWW